MNLSSVRSPACTSVVSRPCTDAKLGPLAGLACLPNCWLSLLTDGASNTVRTGRSASRAVLIAAITRIADSESPPRSKNESSTPTRSTSEYLGVDVGQDLLDRGGRGAVVIASVLVLRVPAGRGCRVCR